MISFVNQRKGSARRHSRHALEFHGTLKKEMSLDAQIVFEIEYDPLVAKSGCQFATRYADRRAGPILSPSVGSRDKSRTLLFPGALDRNRAGDTASDTGAPGIVCRLRTARGSFRLAKGKLCRDVLGEDRGRHPQTSAEQHQESAEVARTLHVLTLSRPRMHHNWVSSPTHPAFVVKNRPVDDRIKSPS